VIVGHPRTNNPPFVVFGEDLIGGATLVNGLEAFINEVDAAHRQDRLPRTGNISITQPDGPLSAWLDRLDTERADFYVHDSRRRATYRVENAWVCGPPGMGSTFTLAVEGVSKVDVEPPS
jgi:hypothetical protein